MTYKPTGLALEIFKDRYAFTEQETWEEACERLAKQMIVPEIPSKQSMIFDNFYDILVRNEFVPGGRVWTNSGRQHPSLLNCFVLGHEIDSKEGWAMTAHDMIVTSMCQGGVGIPFSDVRPSGAEIVGQRGTCPGPIELMRLIDGCGKPIKAGGGRRVALMFALLLTHPDIITFLNSKLKNGELTNANISVICENTKEFIKAIKKDGEIELSWKSKYKTKIKARELWNIIVTNAYNSAEPGFLNMELAEEESTIYYLDKLTCTNPCGEIVMSAYESCCLGHIVLTRFVNPVTNEIDYPKLGKVIRTAVRFLDNVLSVNYYPMLKMKEKAQKLRRIGLGTTGLADMLAMVGVKYGSDESIKLIDKLYRFISKASYEASVMLSIEKGMFPSCDPKKHVESGFVSRLPEKIKQLILENGIRNCAVLTQAPTGTVSILSGNISSGIEPMFAPAYERRFWKDDKRQMELVFHPLFSKFMEEGKSVDHFIGANELTVRQHFEVQATIQKHVDNAISKTINIPYDYPIEDMSELWLEYLPKIKGTTFYRENTRGFVNKDGVVEEPPLKAIPLEEATKRFNKENKTDVVVNDCPKGICELK